MANKVVKSEVTGTVWKIEIKPGDAVLEEQTLMILESMKMEIPVLAPCAATVASVLVKEGNPVKDGQDVVVLELG